MDISGLERATEETSIVRPIGAVRPVTRTMLATGAVCLFAVLVPTSFLLAGGTLLGTLPAVVLYGAMMAIAAIGFDRVYPHDRLGLCNVITLFRAALVGALAVPVVAPGTLADPAHAWLILSIAVFTLALDGVDGFFARRQGLSSRFGARFDMEVDAVFALALAIIAFHLDKAGPFVLLLGLARYIFIGASLIWPWLDGPLPERFSRKLICVIQIGVLIALMAPIVAPPVSFALAAIATLLVVWSFGVDIVWRARNRG